MQLNFPTYNFKIKNKENRHYIFDIVRKMFFVLTPEEWVRQHLIHFLIENCRCPIGLIAVEKKLTIHGLTKRFDVVVFNLDGTPLLLAECKAPQIPINENVFIQAGMYNKVLQVKNVVVTNGIELLYCKYTTDFSTYKLEKSIPLFPFQ